MRRAARAGMLPCAVAFLLSSCNRDAPTAADASAPQASPTLTLATGGSCGTPPTHPGGIIDKVDAPTPWGVAVRDDGLAFFTELYNGGVGITSTKTRTVDGFIPTGEIPTGIAFSPDGATAYVANQYGQVSVLDVATQQVVGTIPVDNPLAVRVSPDGAQLFVATGGTTVYIVDIPTRQVVNSVEVGFAPNGFAVHPDGRMLYVSSFVGGTVSEIDMFTGTVLRTFEVGGTPQEMALNRKGTRLYVANEAGYLNEIELQSGQLAATIPLQGGGFGVGVTPDDGQAYVSIAFTGLVQVFSLQSRSLTKTLDVGGDPRRIAFSQQGRVGAITNSAGYITFVR
jgi:YVTN family beta-propeller protein